MNLPALITSLQTANRTIDDLQDTIHHWKIKYDRLYHQHLKLQQQWWCDACRQRLHNEENIELCSTCSRRIEKELQIKSRLIPASCRPITTTFTVEEPLVSMNTQNNAQRNVVCKCTSSSHPITAEANLSRPSISKISTKPNLTWNEPPKELVNICLLPTAFHVTFNYAIFTSSNLSPSSMRLVTFVTTPMELTWQHRIAFPWWVPLSQEEPDGLSNWPLISTNKFIFTTYQKNVGTYHANHCYWNEHRWTPCSGFLPMQGSPTLHKRSAVIGTRHPPPGTLVEVRRLFQTTSSLEHILDNYSDLYYLLPEHGD